MKKLLLVTVYLILIFSIKAFAQDVLIMGNTKCPMIGDATDPKMEALNQLKNRYIQPKEGDIDKNVSIEKMIGAGKNDVGTFDETKAAEIIAVVDQVIAEKGESCNCHVNDPEFTDTHIYLRSVNDNTSSKTKRVCVEVTPRMRNFMRQSGVNWSSDQLKNLVGHQVRIQGWLTFDFEHANVAQNTNPTGTRNIRATVWELHPVTMIEDQSAEGSDDGTVATEDDNTNNRKMMVSASIPSNPPPSNNNNINNGSPNFSGLDSPSSDPKQLLFIIILSAILGMCGQVIRVVAGMKKVTASSDPNKSVSSVLTDNTRQILFSLLIALIVGGVAGVLVAISSNHFVADKSTIIALITAGYAGTDFIEGIVFKK